MSSLLRRGLAALMACAAALLVLIGAAHLPFVRARVLEWAQARVSGDFGVVVRAESLRYNLLTMTLELEKPALASEEGRPPFLQADAVRVVLNRSALWGSILVERIEIDRPRLSIVRVRDGTTNLPTGSSSAGAEPSPIHLGLVVLDGLSVDVEDEAAGHRLAAGPLDLTMDTSSTEFRPAAFGPAPFAVRYGPADQTLEGTLAGRLGFDGLRLAVPELRIEAPDGRLALDGELDVLAPALNVRANGQIDVDLARARRFLGASGSSLAGSSAVSFTVTGSLTDPAVRLKVLGRDLAYQSVKATELSADAAYAAGRLQVERLDVASNLGSAQARGDLMLGAAAGRSSPGSGHARITGVDVDRVLDAAGVELPILLGTMGEADVDITLADAEALGPNWLQHLTATANGRFSSSSSGLSLGGRLELALESGRWTLEHQLQSSTTHALVTGMVGGQIRPNTDGAIESTLSGKTRVESAEIGALVPVLRQAGVELPEILTEQTGGALDVAVEPRGTIGLPRAFATIRARAIRLTDLPEGDLDSTVEVDRRTVRAKSLDVRMGAARLRASGSYAWSGRIDGRFEAAGDDLGAIARAFGVADVPLAGSATLDGSLQGDARSPRGTAVLTIRDLSVYEVSIGAVDATVGLASWRVNLDARAPARDVQLKGEIDTREPFNFSIDAAFDRVALLELVPPSLRAQVPAEGRMTGSLRARGAMRQLLETTGDIAVQALEGSVSGVPVSLEAPAKILIQPNEIAATPLELRVGRQTEARLSGTLARDAGRAGLDVRVGGDVSDFIEIAAAFLPDLALAVEASRFDADVHVGGTLRAPQPSGTIALTAATLRYDDQPPLNDLALDARIERDRIDLRSANATWQGAKLSAQGSLPLRMVVPAPEPGGARTGLAAWGSDWLASLPSEPSVATLAARVTGITTGALAPYVDPAQLQEVSGTVAATVTAEADAFTLERVRASVALDEASLTLAGVPFAQSVPTRLRLENGRARIEELRWDAQGNEVRVTGGASLVGPSPSLDLAVVGAIDLRILGAFAAGFASGGVARPNLTIAGPLDAPTVVGSVAIEAGEVQVDDPPFAASDLDGTVAIAADRTATIALDGLVNGGSAALAGKLNLETLAEPRGRITLAARNVRLEYPEGLQTESDADLVLVLQPAGSMLSGRVDVLSGIYREPLVVSRGLLSSLSGGAVVGTGTESSFLAGLRLDVAVATTDIRIDNNYGRLGLEANLHVTGTGDRPGVLGRLEAQPDGEIYLGGNTYRIQNLTIDFANPRAIAPEVSFLAETRVGSVPIEIALQCGVGGRCERDVRSQAAGVTNEQAEALLFGVSSDPTAAGEQLARLLSGELLGIVGRTFGLDTLRLEQTAGGRADLFDDPTLVAGDVNPASRLTFGKRLGEHVELAYSQDLAQNGFTTSTSYFAPAGVSIRALLLDDQSRSFEFRHEPRLGAPRRVRPPSKPGAAIAAVRINGNPGFPERDLRGQLRLAEGDRFAFAAWQADRERLNGFYRARGFFEARVRARRLSAAAGTESVPADPDAASIVLEYTIERGRETRLEVSGFDLPAAISRRIVERWTGAIFDRFLERDIALIVREHLYREGRLQAQVAATMRIDDADQSKTLAVSIQPGPETTPRLQFEGNAIVPTSRLLEMADRAGSLAPWLDAASFAAVIRRVYQEEGLLAAEVDVRPPSVQNGESVVRVVIREGDPLEIGIVTLGGADVLPDASARSLDLPSGGRYDPRIVAERVAGLEQRLRDAGYLDARLVAETVLRAEERRADVHVLVESGPRSVLTSIAVEGVRSDSPLIARSLSLNVDQPVSSSALSDTRRRLYESGVYRSVAIDLVPVDAAAPPASLRAGDRGVVARIRVEERPRYTFRYGLAFNDDVTGGEERDRRFGFAADFANRNILGSGATAGLSARVRRDQQVGRLFLGADRFFGVPLRSSLFLSRARQELGSGDTLKTVSDVTEVSAEQTYRLKRFVDLRYGYGLGRNRTTFAGADFDLTVMVARLTTSGSVDRRDDPFDPSRGWFTSTSFELSRPGIGSDLSFLRSYLQFFQFAPIRDRLVLASAVRLGLARTFRGETLIPSERFFGGGATSVRGYSERDLGPRSIFGDADGGQAMFLANGELRFPIFGSFRGVGFVDLGNVYELVGDMTLSDVQVGVGAGLRMSTPVGLLRLDLGAPANPRAFDSKWSVHFGLGHAF